MPNSSTTTLHMGLGGMPLISRGATPTLHINLASNNPGGRNSSEMENDSGTSSVTTSRNFSKSTTNLFSKKALQHNHNNHSKDKNIQK
jgi:hypothetical protein